MKRWGRNASGFTIVELLIVVVIIAILAAITVAVYGGVRKQAASNLAASAASDASKAMAQKVIQGTHTQLGGLPDDLKIPDDISLIYTPLSSARYDGMNNIQRGVLFHDMCEMLIQDAKYSTVHSRDGSQVDTIVMSCDDNIQHNTMQITGWETRTWNTPVTKEQLEQYMTTVPYDPWWSDKQDVVRSFYAALIALYSTSGGTWPIASFWDAWATSSSGVQRQELPPVESNSGVARYCITATHRQYTDISFIVTGDKLAPHQGSCY